MEDETSGSVNLLRDCPHQSHGWLATAHYTRPTEPGIDTGSAHNNELVCINTTGRDAPRCIWNKE